MRYRLNDQTKKFGALHLEDTVKDWLSGRRKREKAISDAMQLSNEVLHRRNELFPVRSVPIPNKPGYVTHNTNFFRIVTRGKKISKDLTYYFTDEHYSPRKDRISYGNAHDLGGFFNFVFHYLLTEGKAFYGIEWKEIMINDRKYNLPISLPWINPSTVILQQSTDGLVAKQKYSWVAKEVNNYYKYQDHAFKKDEFVSFKHPNDFPKSPVKTSMNLLDDLRQWWKFSLWQGKANNERDNHSFPLERTRYRVSSEYRRKQDIARVKVKRIFREPVSGVMPVTDFYEIYSYKESKKHLNNIRRYVVQVFNNQVLKRVQEKNNIKSEIRLEYRGFTTNQKIEKLFSKYKKQIITVNDFIEQIKDRYNCELFTDS